MCSRVTQGQWDLQDLKERMENGYKASADTDFEVIPLTFELTSSNFPSGRFFLSFQGDDGDVGPRGLPGEPVSVSTLARLVFISSLLFCESMFSFGAVPALNLCFWQI